RTRGLVPGALRGGRVVVRLVRHREVPGLAADLLEIELDGVDHRLRLPCRRALQRQVGDDLDGFSAATRVAATGTAARAVVVPAASSGQERQGTEHQDQYRQKIPSSQLRLLVRPTVLSTLLMPSNRREGTCSSGGGLTPARAALVGAPL